MILQFNSVELIRRWLRLCPLLVPLALASPSSAEVASTFTADCESASSHTITHSSRQICQTGLTSPSLWWIREQVGSQLGRKLVSNWQTEPTNVAQGQKVVLVVNSQAWSLLDYFERYEFLHAFGLVAEDFGYALEVKDNRGIEMASYNCSGANQQLCTITFTGSGSGFRGGNRRLF